MKKGQPLADSKWIFFFIIITIVQQLSHSMISLRLATVWRRKKNMGLIFSQSSSIRFSVGQRSPALPLHLMRVNQFQLTGDLGIQPSKDL